MLSSIIEFIKALFGVFSSDQHVKEKARIATACVLGIWALAFASIWLSEPVYRAFAVDYGSDHADRLGYLIASVVAFLILCFGGGVAVNAARGFDQDNPHPIDASFPLVILCFIWLALVAGDMFIQWYGSGLRAVEKSGQIKQTAQVVANPYSGEILILKADLADLDFRNSWCQTHRSRHGSTYQQAFAKSQTGDWTPSCKHQEIWYSNQKDKALRDQKRQLIASYQQKGDAALSLSQKALEDENDTILSIRSTVKRTLRVLTFVLYLIQLLLSIYLAFYLDLWESKFPLSVVSFWDKHRKKEEQIGFVQASAQKAEPFSSANINRLKADIEKLRKDLTTVQSHNSQLSNQRSELSGESGKDAGGFVYSSQREIRMDNSHPAFSSIVQPDVYRGIDEKKYKQMVKAARKVLTDQGKYNQSAISRMAGISRASVPKYLKIAFEKGDLRQ